MVPSRLAGILCLVLVSSISIAGGISRASLIGDRDGAVTLTASDINEGFSQEQDDSMKPPSAQLTSDAKADLVDSMPGWGPVDSFRMFSGYINVDLRAGRNLFYIFTEQVGQRNNDAPLVLWLNGGPGCSSVGGGFMSELGPWFPRNVGRGGTVLKANPHSWNNFANIIFLESPAFVGFSYSETDGDKIVGDERTAVDSDIFMRRFLIRFPQYANNDFFIAGESYAGHYIPQLAWQIYQSNQALPHAQRLHLVGTLVGNAWTDPISDDKGTVEYWWSHALISSETAQGMWDNCAFERVDPTVDEGDHPTHKHPADADERCDNFCASAMEELGNINRYAIYADVCLTSPPEGAQLSEAQSSGSNSAGGGDRECVAAVLEQQRQDKQWEASRLARQARYSAHRSAMLSRALGLPLVGGEGDVAGSGAIVADGVAPLTAIRAALQSARGQRRAGDVSARIDWGARILQAASVPMTSASEEPRSSYDPCVDDEAAAYLNRPSVQRALHANQTAAARRALPDAWADCSAVVDYSMVSMFDSMLPVYKNLMEHAGLRMLVYSGDVDSDVSVLATRGWLGALNLTQHRSWKPWTDCDGQVGGYVVHYDHGMSFSTVRNAGHMVPYTQPARMVQMLRSFLGVGGEDGCGGSGPSALSPL